jgi:hypothetical protein
MQAFACVSKACYVLFLLGVEASMVVVKSERRQRVEARWRTEKDALLACEIGGGLWQAWAGILDQGTTPTTKNVGVGEQLGKRETGRLEGWRHQPFRWPPLLLEAPCFASFWLASV